MLNFGKKKSVKRVSKVLKGKQYALRKTKAGLRIVQVVSKVTKNGRHVTVYKASGKRVSSGVTLYKTKTLAKKKLSHMKLSKKTSKSVKKSRKGKKKASFGKKKKVSVGKKILRSRFGLEQVVGDLIVKVPKGRKGFVVCADVKNASRFRVYNASSYRIGSSHEMLVSVSTEAGGPRSLYRVPDNAEIFSVPSGSTAAHTARVRAKAAGIAKMYNHIAPNVDLSMIKCHVGGSSRTHENPDDRLASNSVVSKLLGQKYNFDNGSQVQNFMNRRALSRAVTGTKEVFNISNNAATMQDRGVFSKVNGSDRPKNLESIFRRATIGSQSENLSNKNIDRLYNGFGNKSVNYGFSRYL
jgi:hypothetical protein